MRGTLSASPHSPFSTSNQGKGIDNLQTDPDRTSDLNLLDPMKNAISPTSATIAFVIAGRAMPESW